MRTARQKQAHNSGIAMIVVVGVMAVFLVLSLLIVSAASAAYQQHLEFWAQNQAREAAASLSQTLEEALQDPESAFYGYVRRAIEEGQYPALSLENRSYEEIPEEQMQELTAEQEDIGRIQLHWYWLEQENQQELVILVSCTRGDTVCTVTSHYCRDSEEDERWHRSMRY